MDADLGGHRFGFSARKKVATFAPRDGTANPAGKLASKYGTTEFMVTKILASSRKTPLVPELGSKLLRLNRRAEIKKLAEDWSLRCSQVDLLVALSTQGNQVLLGIIAKQTARLDMMDLQISQRPAALAPPSVSLEHSHVQSLVGLGIEL
ncbi:MAG: hypothetical protein WBC04_20370 [Candidatus Acidiferrales bacterium]